MLRPVYDIAGFNLQRTEDLDLHYFRECATSSDINAHLPILRRVAEMVRHGDGVVEFGVRNIVSTWALLAARPVRGLISVDIERPPEDRLREVERCAFEANVAWQFVCQSTLELPRVKCGMLFIDTLHTARQLSLELVRHAPGVARFIALHDTVSFGFEGEDGTVPGLQSVVELLCDGGLAEGLGDWGVVWHDEANNGLTIVERRP